MAEVATVVDLSKKEVLDAVTAAAKGLLKCEAGGLRIKIHLDSEGVTGATVKFSWPHPLKPDVKPK